MATNPTLPPQNDTHRYKAVVRVSKAIAACREPQELASTLADEIGKVLQFDHLHIAVLKEDSTEIEYLWGKNGIAWPDLPMEELSNSITMDRSLIPASNALTAVPRVRKRPPPAWMAASASLAY